MINLLRKFHILSLLLCTLYLVLLLLLLLFEQYYIRPYRYLILFFFLYLLYYTILYKKNAPVAYTVLYSIYTRINGYTDKRIHNLRITRAIHY